MNYPQLDKITTRLRRWSYRLIPLVLLIVGLAATRLFVISVQAQGGGSTEILVANDDTSEDFYQGSFYRTGVSRQPAPEGDGNGEIRLLAVGLAGDWRLEADPTGLPARQGHTVEAYLDQNGVEHVYLIAGENQNLSVQSDIYHTTIHTSTAAGGVDALGDWEQLSSVLPEPRSRAETAIVKDHLFVIGGLTASDMPTNTVYVAPINPSNGSVGSFSETAPLILPSAYDCDNDTTPETDASRAQMAVAVYNGTIYVIGGLNRGFALTQCVLYATPDGNGNITQWNRTQFDYPTPVYGNAAVTYDDYIYGVGGSNAKDDVYFVQPDAQTGNITQTWTQGTSDPNTHHLSTLTAYNGQLLLIGGAINNRTKPVNTVNAVLLNRDHSLDQWISSEPLRATQEGRVLHDAVVSSRGWIYVIGGSTTEGSGAINSIDYGTLSGKAKRYASSGDFTSRPIEIDPETERQVTKMRWTAFFSETSGLSATLEYRTANDEFSLGNAPWSQAYQTTVDGPAIPTTNTVAVNETAKFAQYRVKMNTSISDTTPIIQRVQFLYEVPKPDMTVSKQPNVSEALPGQYVTYTINVENIQSGSSQARDVRITETIPSFTDFDSSSPLQFQPVGTLPDGSKQYAVTLTDTLAANISDTLTFALRVTDTIESLPESPFLTNTVEVGAVNEDPVKLNNNVYTDTLPLGLVNLELTKSNEPAGSVQPGERITYTLSYSNTSDHDASGVTLLDSVPANVVLADSGGGGSGPNLQWNIGVVPAHTGGKRTFNVEVKTADLTGTQINNTATIQSNDTLSKDSNTVSNAIDVNALLAASKEVSPGRVEAGSLLTYTIHYTNAGNIELDQVRITDTVPAYTSVLSDSLGGSVSGSYNSNTGVLSWNVGTLGLGASGTAQFQVRVDRPIAAGITTIANTAFARAQGVPPIETNAATAEMISTPNLKINKVASPGYGVIPGDEIQFTLQYYNVGPVDAAGVVITDRLPADTTLVDPGGATIVNDNGDTVLRWNIGPVDALGGDGSRTFTVQVADSLGANSGIANDEYRISAPGQGVATWGDPIYVPPGADFAALRIIANQTVFRPVDTDALNITVVAANNGNRPNDDTTGIFTDLYVYTNSSDSPSKNDISNVDTWWYPKHEELINGQTAILHSKGSTLAPGAVGYPNGQLAEGIYYAFAQVNTDAPSSDFPVEEWPRANNIVGPLVFTVTKQLNTAPPDISNVSPTQLEAADGVQITINGDHFQAGVMVSLKRDGDVRRAVAISRTNSNTIEATFNMKGQLLGPWDLVVKNPDDGTGTLRNGVTLVEGDGGECPPDCKVFLPVLQGN